MPRTKCLLLALVLFIRPLTSLACGNEYYSTSELPLQAKKLDLRLLLHFAGDHDLPYWTFGFGENIIDKRNRLAARITGTEFFTGPVSWAALEQALKTNTDYKLLSDFAWYELRVGSKQHAVRLLERLYEKYPGEYNIVANLGTAYEVTGKNEQALTLLKKAVAINPQSHYGSEWIHVNILEQKVKAAPDYTRILELGSGKNYPQWLSGQVYDKKIAPDSLMVQVAYQLHERISFIAPPDPIVAQLILDFADLAAIARSRLDAKEFYNYAVSYDSTLVAATKERIEATPAMVMNAKKKSSSGNYGLYIVLAAGLAAGAIWLLIRRKKISR